MLQKIERGVFLTYLKEEKKAAKKGEACEFEVMPLSDKESTAWIICSSRLYDNHRGDDEGTLAQAIVDNSVNKFVQVVKRVRNGDTVLETPEEIAKFTKERMTLDQRDEISETARDGKGQTDHIDKMRLKNA